MKQLWFALQMRVESPIHAYGGLSGPIKRRNRVYSVNSIGYCQLELILVHINAIPDSTSVRYECNCVKRICPGLGNL